MIFKRSTAIQRNKLLILEEPSEALAPYRVPFTIGEHPVESARDYLKACSELQTFCLLLLLLLRRGVPSYNQFPLLPWCYTPLYHIKVLRITHLIKSASDVPINDPTTAPLTQ